MLDLRGKVVDDNEAAPANGCRHLLLRKAALRRWTRKKMWTMEDDENVSDNQDIHIRMEIDTSRYDSVLLQAEL